MRSARVVWWCAVCWRLVAGGVAPPSPHSECLATDGVTLVNLTGIAAAQEAAATFYVAQTAAGAVYANPCGVLSPLQSNASCAAGAAVCMCGDRCRAVGWANESSWATASDAVSKVYEGEACAGPTAWNATLAFSCSISAAARGVGSVSAGTEQTAGCQGRVGACSTCLQWQTPLVCPSFPAPYTSNVQGALPGASVQAEASAGETTLVARMFWRDQFGLPYVGGVVSGGNFTLSPGLSNCTADVAVATLVPLTLSSGLWALRIVAPAKAFGWQGTWCEWNVTVLPPPSAPGAAEWDSPLLASVVVNVMPEPFNRRPGRNGLTVGQVIMVVAGSAFGCALLFGGWTLWRRRTSDVESSSTWRRDTVGTRGRGILANDGTYISAESRALLQPEHDPHLSRSDRLPSPSASVPQRPAAASPSPRAFPATPATSLPPKVSSYVGYGLKY
jgi:hypothetical protein